MEWEITTVLTAKALAFNVEEMEVRIISERLFPICLNRVNDSLILAIKSTNYRDHLPQEQAISTESQRPRPIIVLV